MCATIGILAYVSFLIWLTSCKIEIDYMKNPPGTDCKAKSIGLDEET